MNTGKIFKNDPFNFLISSWFSPDVYNKKNIAHLIKFQYLFMPMARHRHTQKHTRHTLVRQTFKVISKYSQALYDTVHRKHHFKKCIIVSYFMNLIKNILTHKQTQNWSYLHSICGGVVSVFYLCVLGHLWQRLINN